MDSFSSPSSSSPSSQMSAEDFMDQLKVQLAQAYAEEFLETVRGKCFEKCITKPGSSLSGGESSCVSRCVDRYIEATGIISRSLFNAQRRGSALDPKDLGRNGPLKQLVFVLLDWLWVKNSDVVRVIACVA
ncbi:hypothetical protein R6Q57_012342 [Mikania cordata]